MFEEKKLKKADRISVPFFIYVRVMDMKDGEIEAVMYHGNTFKLEKEKELKQVSKDFKVKKRPRNIKKSYLQKWIELNDIQVFSLDRFFKVYPKQRRNKRLNHNIAKLIKEKKIVQVGKNQFQVLK